MESCNYILEQEKCNDEPIGQEGLYCFKANVENEDLTEGEDKTQCMTFPTNPDHQKLFFQLINGINKESFSTFGMLDTNLYSELLSTFESQLWKSNKESYNIDETIEIGPDKLSNVDKTTLNSEQTCSYYYYGRYFKQPRLPSNEENPNRKYENINDKNICYGAKKFNEFKNLIDCGYAEIKVRLEDQDYEIKTCYLMPTAKLPAIFNEFYSSFQKELLINTMLRDIIYTMAGKEIEDDSELDPGRRLRRRRLSTDFTFNIDVENKYGRKITFSSTNENSYTVTAEGQPGPEEPLDTEGGNKSSYIGINLILLIILSAL